MIEKIDFDIHEFADLTIDSRSLNFIGNAQLLNKRKISIVGTRRPSQYTQSLTAKLAQELSNRGIITVSGAAMGVDAIVHKFSKDYQTIAVVVIYNKKLYSTKTNLTK